MSYQDLGRAIQKIYTWLNKSTSIDYSLVGGLAVSFRTIERATKDIDFVIAVSGDAEAESVIRELKLIGFNPVTLLEHKVHKVISTVRLLSDEFPGVYLDILFSTTGIEHEIVKSSEEIEILDGISLKVASISSLIAMKVLSCTNEKRRQDLLDLDNLINSATRIEIDESMRLVRLIVERGFNHGKNLEEVFLKLLRENEAN